VRETNARLSQLQAQIDAIPGRLQDQVDAIPGRVQRQIEAIPWQVIPEQLGDLRKDIDSQLESIHRAMGELGEGSAAMQEAVAQGRRETEKQVQALGRRVDGVAEALRTALDKGLRDLDRRLEDVQGLGSQMDGIEHAQADLVQHLDRIGGRLDRIEEHRAHIDEVQRLVRDQRAHIEELQRLVGILTEAEEARRNRRRLGSTLLRPFAAVGAGLARPLRRPWNRVKWSANASREHWQVRRSRLRREPKLGRLQHHSPMPLQIPDRYLNSAAPANPPSISIVTPSLNQGDFLERTIRSVVDQEYPRLEYIVQDGRSTDHTRDVLERYSNRIEHWEMEPDDGQAQAINLGFSRATGEVMAYLNSDDLLLPGSLRYVGRFFEAHPEVDVIYGHRVLVDENDMEIGRWILPRHRDSVLDWADFIPQETLFWRRRAWESAGAQLDEEFRFALDWDLLLRMRDAGARMVRVPRFLGAFRVHTAQKTSAQLDDAGADEMDRIRRRVHNRNVSQEEVDRELRRYLRRHVNLHKLYRAGLIHY
jgi:glycosyltransferase involved in cell wall biosynthesis